MAKSAALRGLIDMGRRLIKDLGGTSSAGVTPNYFDGTLSRIDQASDWGELSNAANRAKNAVTNMTTGQVGAILPALRRSIDRISEAGVEDGDKWVRSRAAAEERIRTFEEQAQALAGGSGAKVPPSKKTAAAADEPNNVDSFVEGVKNNIKEISDYGEAEQFSEILVTMRDSQPEIFDRLKSEGLVDAIRDATVTTLIRALNNRKAVNQVDEILGRMSPGFRAFLSESSDSSTKIREVVSRNKVKLLKKAYDDAVKIYATNPAEGVKRVRLIEKYILAQKSRTTPSGKAASVFSPTQVESLRASGTAARGKMENIKMKGTPPPEGGAPARSGTRTPPRGGSGGADPLAVPLDQVDERASMSNEEYLEQTALRGQIPSWWPYKREPNAMEREAIGRGMRLDPEEGIWYGGTSR